MKDDGDRGGFWRLGSESKFASNRLIAKDAANRLLPYPTCVPRHWRDGVRRIINFTWLNPRSPNLRWAFPAAYRAQQESPRHCSGAPAE